MDDYVRNFVIAGSVICTLSAFLVAAGVPFAVLAMPGGVGLGFYLAAGYIWFAEWGAV